MLLYTTVTALNHESFELERNFGNTKLTSYLSIVLCTIDLKFAYIYYDFESNVLDGVINKTNTSVPIPANIIA